MTPAPYSPAMISFPNAKINLGLHVVSRRPDGYHCIETVFYPVPLCDALEIVPAETFSFRTYGLALDASTDDNLVMRALAAMRREADIPPAAIHLKKAIPFGAGLGGGSSDAAFMLKLLRQYAQLDLTDDALERIATRLGADCAFFVRNRPVMATGIGDVFRPTNISLAGYHIAIVKPSVSVSTREAYAAIHPAAPVIPLDEIITRPVTEWRHALKNDFESPVFARHPAIGHIKAQLYDAGALYAAMSGSGSAVFGLFHREPSLPPFTGCFVWQGQLE